MVRFSSMEIEFGLSAFTMSIEGCSAASGMAVAIAPKMQTMAMHKYDMKGMYFIGDLLCLRLLETLWRFRLFSVGYVSMARKNPAKQVIVSVRIFCRGVPQ